MMRKSALLILVLIFVFCLGIPVAWGQNAPNRTLSLQEAINMALNNDETLKMAEKEIDRTKALRDEAGTQVSFIPIAGSGNAFAEAAYYNLLKADFDWQKSKKEYSIAHDAVAMNTSAKYWNAVVALDNLKLQEQVRQQALINLRNARVSYQAGIISKSDLTIAQSKYNQVENSLIETQKSVDDAFTALNQIIGLNIGERPILTDKLTYDPLQVISLDYAIEKAIESSPKVWEAQQNITLAERGAYLQVLQSGGQYVPYEARKISVEQANLNAENIKNLTSQRVRDLYFQIKSLEEKYTTAQESLRQAQENLRVTKMKYDNGLVIKSTVLEAEVNLSQAEIAIEGIIMQHVLLKLQLAAPWITTT